MNTDMPPLRALRASRIVPGRRLGQAIRALARAAPCALLIAAAGLCHAAPPAPVDVTIYADDGYPPYSYGEDGKARGIYAEILNKAFEQMPQYRVTVVPVPWKRGLRLLESGQGFALYPPYFRPDERPYIKYSEPILDEQVVVFCNRLTTSNRNLKTWPDDYVGLTIGTNAGFLLGGKEFDRYVAAGRITRDSSTSSHGSVLKMLSGRNDCYINDRLAIRWEVDQIRRHGEVEAQRIAIVETNRLYSEKGHLGFTDRDDGRFEFKNNFMQDLNAAIIRMKNDGEIDRAVERFLNALR